MKILFSNLTTDLTLMTDNAHSEICLVNDSDMDILGSVPYEGATRESIVLFVVESITSSCVDMYDLQDLLTDLFDSDFYKSLKSEQ